MSDKFVVMSEKDNFVLIYVNCKAISLNSCQSVLINITLGI